MASTAEVAMVTSEENLKSQTSTVQSTDFYTTALSSIDANGVRVTIDDDQPSFAPNSLYSQLEKYSSYRTVITMAEHKYYYLVPFSVVSNIFCFVVLFKNLKKSTAYMLMANIAIWDAATMVMRGWIIMLFLHGWNVGDTGCAIIRAAENITQPVAVWLVILLTADRVIAVWFPFKYRRLCTMPRALAAYAFVVVMICCVCVNNFWTVAGVSDPPHYSCKSKAQYKEQKDRFLWAYFIVQSLLPTVIVILLNVALVYRLRQNRAKMSGMKAAGGGQPSKKTSENHVTVMALVISISFLLLVSPQTVYDIIYTEWGLDINPGKDIESYVNYYIGITVVYFLVDLNHCINIFLYFVSGTRFRRDALRLLTCYRLGGKEKAVPCPGGGQNKKKQGKAQADNDNAKKMGEGGEIEVDPAV